MNLALESNLDHYDALWLMHKQVREAENTHTKYTFFNILFLKGNNQQHSRAESFEGCKMDIYSNMAKYMGCREIAPARVTRECLVCHLEHILTLLVRPCCLQDHFSHFLLSPLSLNMLCQRKCTNEQQPPLCLVVDPPWRRLKPDESWDKTPSNLL